MREGTKVPLTPALFRRERGIRAGCRGRCRASSAVLLKPSRPQGNSCQMHRAGSLLSPLPGGEGQGEGSRTGSVSCREANASGPSPRPSPVGRGGSGPALVGPVMRLPRSCATLRGRKGSRIGITGRVPRCPLSRGERGFRAGRRGRCRASSAVLRRPSRPQGNPHRNHRTCPAPSPLPRGEVRVRGH